MIRLVTYSGCAFEALTSRQQSACTCAILSSVACPAVPCFFFFLHYLLNGTIFEKKFLNIKFVFGFAREFCLNVLFFKKNSTIYHYKCKVPVVLVRL